MTTETCYKCGRPFGDGDGYDPLCVRCVAEESGETYEERPRVHTWDEDLTPAERASLYNRAPGINWFHVALLIVLVGIIVSVLTR